MLKDYEAKRTPLQLEALRTALAEIPGARIVVKKFEKRSTDRGADCGARVCRTIWSCSRRVAEVERLLGGVEGTRSINNSLRVRRTDLRVAINKPMAAILASASLACG